MLHILAVAVLSQSKEPKGPETIFLFRRESIYLQSFNVNLAIFVKGKRTDLAFGLVERRRAWDEPHTALFRTFDPYAGIGFVTGWPNQGPKIDSHWLGDPLCIKSLFGLSTNQAKVGELLPIGKLQSFFTDTKGLSIEFVGGSFRIVDRSLKVSGQVFIRTLDFLHPYTVSAQFDSKTGGLVSYSLKPDLSSKIDPQSPLVALTVVRNGSK